MAEFRDSEHTDAFGTAKLSRNECPNVKIRVREARKMRKTQVGAYVPRGSYVGAASATAWRSAATWRFLICRSTTGVASALAVTRGAAVPCRAESGSTCGVVRWPLAAPPMALESSGLDDEIGSGAGARRRRRKVAEPPERCGGSW